MRKNRSEAEVKYTSNNWYSFFWAVSLLKNYEIAAFPGEDCLSPLKGWRRKENVLTSLKSKTEVWYLLMTIKVKTVFRQKCSILTVSPFKWTNKVPHLSKQSAARSQRWRTGQSKYGSVFRLPVHTESTFKQWAINSEELDHLQSGVCSSYSSV